MLILLFHLAHCYFLLKKQYLTLTGREKRDGETERIEISQYDRRFCFQIYDQ